MDVKKANSVEEYIEINSNFAKALQILRNLITSTELVETFKWNAPTYYLDNKKVVALGAFKNHFSLWFHQGSALRDDKNLLIKGSERTKHLRQMRFETLSDIDKAVVLSYVKEAITNQRT